MIMEALVASEFVSAVLGLMLVYFFSRAYRFRHFAHLFGLPFGFSFLASSYVFLGLYLLSRNDVVLSESFLWLRLIAQSYGFAFIAFTYYFSARAERTMRHFLGVISLVSVFPILLFLAALIVAPPFMGLPSVHVVDEVFMVGNLVFLGYVIFCLVKHLESSGEVTFDLVWTPFAFSVLWFGQYCMFIWEVDGSLTAFVSAHVARLVSLLLFMYVYHMSRGVRGEGGETD